ncbi:T9SS C-terminal target domain-containing protein [Chryseobacterium sp. H3056]|uniref:T9SS C-terminal target domain-containing protein n=1 Tax=Kaistella daneshvariae TaxID=2487074 RepID=A0A3N0WSY4_9FLAO|nr:T9SS type A sorting domain-containing protein [Kaistella daneshvariae]ROI08073.1 T9SS C-terminal target domain-containing protein [Kaistella daneshvariae]
MIKYSLLIFCFFAHVLTAQTSSAAKAPNSYIYDIDLAQQQGFSGIEIPVKKAYDMWSDYEFLKANHTSTPIPAGTQTASLYWEDLPGLVQSVAIVSQGEPSSSKIKVNIDNARGKGNAVIAFKVNGTIYWSWHIWVTDNPENGVTYTQGFETDIKGNPVTVQYMDRNLGAASSSFLGDQWQKSGGLMYQWGRKDPFPPLIYKDSFYYEISGEVGVLKHKQVDSKNTIPVKIRPFDEIEKNIEYAVKNPLVYIINTDNTGNWFSSSRYKVAGVSPNYVTWDLWSDNAKGENSNASSSSTTLKKESASYELKSELDPCPSGWRVPSYYGRETQNNNLSFFGRKNSGVNDDSNIQYRQIFPDAENTSLKGIKVYPGLGMDFTNAQDGARNIGIMPVPGAYVYYPNANSPTAPVGVTFQDNQSNGGLWSATFAYDGARLFSILSDPYRNSTSVGLHAIYNNETNPTRTGNAVRCMRDPNMAAIGDFATQYFSDKKENYRVGLDNPNSYILTGNQKLVIPVSKAFSVYNQLLTQREMLPSDKLVAKVLWTTNENLIAKVNIRHDESDARNSVIEVTTNANTEGNAVVSLHNGDVNGPVYWSWHIWVTNENPTEKTVKYTTESQIPAKYNIQNTGTTKLPSMTTEFMDRNLGALSSDITSGKANGLHYQWGRKDPLPSFSNGSQVFVKTEKNAAEGADFVKVSSADYANRFSLSYDGYGSKNSAQHKKVKENLKYSVQNPMIFLFQRNTGAVYNGGNHYDNNLNEVRDWASDGRAQAAERWGHADVKSPFDPCPEGWRVPDVTFTNLYTGSKGNSPWYNGYQTDTYGKTGVIQDQWQDITKNYSGQVEGTKGWKFANSIFNIGDFPADGIRGELGENQLTFDRSGVWTASMADFNTGFALAMQFQKDKMQTATGVYPQAAMSVRCAKDVTRLLGTPRETKVIKVTVPKVEAPAQTVTTTDVQIYPNPFTTEFSIKNKDSQLVEIYDMSGKMVLKSSVQDNKVNTTNLLPGLYIAKIVMKDKSVVTKKIIKR